MPTVRLVSLLPLPLLPLLPLLLLSACQPPDPPPTWIDLTTETIRVELRGVQHGSAPTALDLAVRRLPSSRAAQRAALDAPDEPRVLDRLLGTGWPGPGRFDPLETGQGGRIRSVEHSPEQQLVWTLDLPAEPHLTFRPMGARRPGCVATQRWEIRHGGDVRTLYEAEERVADRRWGPAEVVLDLTPWVGEGVELVASGSIQADPQDSADACRDAVLGWGSPIVWSSGEVESARPPGSLERPNVILVGLDTVRADHLGAWGRRPSPTPALDALAAESDVFEDAFATFNATNPSFASIFTGLYGKNHGVYSVDSQLDDDAETLAEAFRRNGYVTQAVVAANHLDGASSGLGQGFDGVHSPYGQWTAEEVVRRGLQWLQSVEEAQAPFFLWLHFFDPHTPQNPPLPYAYGNAPGGFPGLGPVSAWRQMRPAGGIRYANLRLGAAPDLYDDELAYMDRQLGRLLDALRLRGLLETSWIVVVADHGENLGEHGLECRHAGLWDTTTHVPLMIRPPSPMGRQGTRQRGLVQTIDLFPTILRLAGLETTPSDGEDLYQLVDQGGRDRVFSEPTSGPGGAVRTATHLYYIQGGDQQLVEPGAYFYDLLRDPQQEENLAGRGLPQEEILAQTLEDWLADRTRRLESHDAELDEERREQLRALGYLDE